MKKVIFVLLFMVSMNTLLSQSYLVEIDGVKDKEVLRSFKEGSQTIALQKKNLPTAQALRKRAEADIARFQKIARYYGYLDAHITTSLKKEGEVKLIFHVDLGTLYTLINFQVLPGEFANLPHENRTLLPLPKTLLHLNPAKIGIDIGKPARTDELVTAEERALTWLKKRGYAFCKTAKKEAAVDTHSKTVTFTLFVDLGPLVTFGKTTIYGNKTVHDSFIKKHILWKDGEKYSADKIEKTQLRLENSGLFSSVFINEHSDQLHDNELPMDIALQEAKHRTVSAGVNYTTSKGPGITGGWENRNLRGEGDVLSVGAELWRRYQYGKVTFRHPHFYDFYQDLVFELEYEKRKIAPFHEKSAAASTYIERRISKRTKITGGVKIEFIHSQNKEQIQTNHLLKAPFQIKYLNADDNKDPTKGVFFNIGLTPSYQYLEPRFTYLIHNSTVGCYIPITSYNTFALKLSFSNVFGPHQHTIPIPDRVFAGSENTLRGYRFMTVSPLSHGGHPLGGRSMLAAGLEWRIRTRSSLGYVLFYDVGNVFARSTPTLEYKMLSSVGFGVRYETPLGPLRFDIGIPLQRRHNIDPPFQVYFSIGHTF